MEYVHLRIPHHQVEPVLNRLDDFFRTAKQDRWDADDRYDIVGMWRGQQIGEGVHYSDGSARYSVGMTVEVMVRIQWDTRRKDEMLKYLSIQES